MHNSRGAILKRGRKGLCCRTNVSGSLLTTTSRLNIVTERIPESSCQYIDSIIASNI